MRNHSISFSAARSAILVCLALGMPLAIANDDGNTKSTVSAAFGRGLNVPASNPVNQVVLPKDIKVKAGGVVDFGVAGFHDIIIFKPGVTLQDLADAGGGQYPSFAPVFVLQPDATLPVNVPALEDKIYYRGLNPAGGPPQTAVTTNPSNSSNRSEPVAFLEKGKYLVICNVRPHLLNGMYAYVTVSDHH
jgi:plastocyanin